MAKNAIVVAGPKLQKALKDLAGGVKNIDLSTEKAPPKPQQILARTAKPSAYDGMFAVSLVGDTITVCDGGDPDSGTAGYYYFNGNLRHANSAVGIHPSVGWLCLKDSMLGQSGSFEIVTMLSSKPTGEDTTDYHPLARIDKNGESWTIRQILKWQIPQMWAFASCDTQE